MENNCKSKNVVNYWYDGWSVKEEFLHRICKLGFLERILFLQDIRKNSRKLCGDIILKYCDEEYLILNFSVRVNFSSDINERYDIELGKLMELYSNDLSVLRPKLKELDEKYQQIGWF